MALLHGMNNQSAVTRRRIFVAFRLTYLVVFLSGATTGFEVKAWPLTHRHRGGTLDRTTVLFADQKGTDEDLNPLAKASWYAVELFGNTFGKTSKEDKGTELDTTSPPKSIRETYERIQQDNDRSYFLSGEVDQNIYDPDCVFSDPFVSFSGTERFVTNLANLGSFITKYDAKLLDYSQPDDVTIQTKLMVKLELNLPWKPVLAWPWGVKYTIDQDSNLVVNHEESWDIDAWEGTKQIFRKPTVKL